MVHQSEVAGRARTFGKGGADTAWPFVNRHDARSILALVPRECGSQRACGSLVEVAGGGVICGRSSSSRWHCWQSPASSNAFARNTKSSRPNWRGLGKPSRQSPTDEGRKFCAFRKPKK